MTYNLIETIYEAICDGRTSGTYKLSKEECIRKANEFKNACPVKTVAHIEYTRKYSEIVNEFKSWSHYYTQISNLKDEITKEQENSYALFWSFLEAYLQEEMDDCYIDYQAEKHEKW